MVRDAGEVQEENFMTGDGAKKPLGVFTASADGISTARDIAFGTDATTIAADNVINTFYNLKAQYQRNATWLLHRLVLRDIRKLKGSDNNYLWQPGLQVGQPDSLLGRPVVQSEFAPSTIASSQYVALVGDFSFYWIADAMNVEFQVLVELNARQNQISIIGRLKNDGAPQREEPFSRGVMPA